MRLRLAKEGGGASMATLTQPKHYHNHCGWGNNPSKHHRAHKNPHDTIIVDNNVLVTYEGEDYLVDRMYFGTFEFVGDGKTYTIDWKQCNKSILNPDWDLVKVEFLNHEDFNSEDSTPPEVITYTIDSREKFEDLDIMVRSHPANYDFLEKMDIDPIYGDFDDEVTDIAPMEPETVTV